ADRPAERPADEGRRDEDGDRTDRDASTYRVEARVILANDNEPSAPTLFGRYGSAGLLSFVGIGEVQHGRYGTTHLDGAKFALLGRGEWKPGRLDSLYIYVDSSAPADQERAIVTILKSEPGLRARSTSVTFTKIELEREGTGA